MQVGGEAADQVVKMSLEGAEFAIRVAGEGATRIMAILVSVLREENKTRGKARLDSMLRSGKELKVFTVKNGDLKKFTQEAKKYGVLYNVLADRKTQDPNVPVDIIARAEDAAKISRIMERFNLSSVDVASVVAEAERSRDNRMVEQSEQEVGQPEQSEKQTEHQTGQDKEDLLRELFGETEQTDKKNPLRETKKTTLCPCLPPGIKKIPQQERVLNSRGRNLLCGQNCGRFEYSGKRRSTRLRYLR